MKRYLPLLLAGVVFTGTACADDLAVTVSQPAPMTVQLTGPEQVVSIATKGFEGIPMGGCMYSIDWGDGDAAPKLDFSDEPPHCVADLTHVYTAAGAYTITVETYDIGPADGPENQRQGKITVTVQ